WADSRFTTYVVLIIAQSLGRVAVSRCYTADDPTAAIEDEILFQHAFLQQEYTKPPRKTAISGGNPRQIFSQVTSLKQPKSVIGLYTSTGETIDDPRTD